MLSYYYPFLMLAFVISFINPLYMPVENGDNPHQKRPRLGPDLDLL
jgi:hypothetical protein